MLKILWINPVGTDLYDLPIAEMLKEEAGNGTQVDIVSLPRDRPITSNTTPTKVL